MSGLVRTRARRSRPRGFIAAWTPGPARERLLSDIEAVLEEFAAYLPVTLQQIYYRLVATCDYPKDNKAYKRLGAC